MILVFQDPIFPKFTIAIFQALDKKSKDGRIVAVKKIKLGSRFVARVIPRYFYLKYLHDF